MIYILRRFSYGVMTYMNIGMMPPLNPTHGPGKCLEKAGGVCRYVDVPIPVEIALVVAKEG